MTMLLFTVEPVSKAPVVPIVPIMVHVFEKKCTSRNGAGNALKSLPTSQNPNVTKHIRTVQFGRHCAPGQHLMTRTSPVGNSNTTMEGVELYLATRLCQQEKETAGTAQLLEKPGRLTLKTTTATWKVEEWHANPAKFHVLRVKIRDSCLFFSTRRCMFILESPWPVAQNLRWHPWSLFPQFPFPTSSVLSKWSSSDWAGHISTICCMIS